MSRDIDRASAFIAECDERENDANAARAICEDRAEESHVILVNYISHEANTRDTMRAFRRSCNAQDANEIACDKYRYVYSIFEQTTGRPTKTSANITPYEYVFFQRYNRPGYRRKTKLIKRISEGPTKE